MSDDSFNMSGDSRGVNVISILEIGCQRTKEQPRSKEVANKELRSLMERLIEAQSWLAHRRQAAEEH